MYDELIKSLRNYAEVYKLTDNENTQEYVLLTEAANAIEDLEKRLERKKGKWEECEVIDIEDTTIEEVQSQRCSVCERYLTTPYSYYFEPYNFCPNCGAGCREE